MAETHILGGGLGFGRNGGGGGEGGGERERGVVGNYTNATLSPAV